MCLKGERIRVLLKGDTWLFSWKITYRTDWETTHLGHIVELEWRLKDILRSIFICFEWITSRYAFSFFVSKTQMLHAISHEWSRSVHITLHFFVCNTKLYFPCVCPTLITLGTNLNLREFLRVKAPPWGLTSDEVSLRVPIFMLFHAYHLGYFSSNLVSL